MTKGEEGREDTSQFSVVSALTPQSGALSLRRSENLHLVNVAASLLVTLLIYFTTFFLSF